MDPDVAGLEGDPRAALGHVERVGDAHDSRFDRVRLAAAAVADDRVQRLRRDDRALGLVVDAVEQLVELARGEQEAERLVVGAVDRETDVVQHRAGRDDHLGVAVAHPVIGHHRRLDAALDEQAQQAQGDVEHHLDVDP